jgi:hypothetical protein
LRVWPVAFDKLKNLLNVDIKDGLPGSAVVQSSNVPTEAARSYRLSKLRESGVLSEAEFEAEKARILAG